MSPDFTLTSESVTKLLGSIIVDTIASGVTLSERDYFNMSSGGQELNRLISSGISTAQTFKDIESYFKRNPGETVQRDNEIFSRAAQEMTEFVAALGSAKIRALFAAASEPKGTAKPAYFDARASYNSTGFSRGTSSRVSSGATPTRKKHIGFGDTAESVDTGADTNRVIIDNQVGASSPSTPLRSVSMKKPNIPPTSDKTPSVSNRTPSRRVISIGFAEDSSPEGSIAEMPGFDPAMTNDELTDMSLVSDFIDPANADSKYRVNSTVVEFVRESVRKRRAVSDIAKDVLRIIRETRASSEQIAISTALGYDDIDSPDVSSNIVQWILRNVA